MGHLVTSEDVILKGTDAYAIHDRDSVYLN